jgi:GNAT superfamily N-acetyltransferase
MPVVACGPLTPAQLGAAAELAAEYLDAADALRADFAARPDLAVTLTVDGVVAGVAFGHPDGEDGVTLEGIAVTAAHAARGLGSRLLSRFERAAADAGGVSVGLGSGGGYVEHFYVKNGYRQTEYMIVIPGGDRRRLDLGDREVLRERHWAPDELVLNVATPEGYAPPVKAALAARLGARQVCCIFCKPLAGPTAESGGVQAAERQRFQVMRRPASGTRPLATRASGRSGVRIWCTNVPVTGQAALFRGLRACRATSSGDARWKCHTTSRWLNPSSP